MPIPGEQWHRSWDRKSTPVADNAVEKWNWFTGKERHLLCWWKMCKLVCRTNGKGQRFTVGNWKSDIWWNLYFNTLRFTVVKTFKFSISFPILTRNRKYIYRGINTPVFYLQGCSTSPQTCNEQWSTVWFTVVLWTAKITIAQWF